MSPNLGMESRTNDPGVHLLSCLGFMVILVVSPSRRESVTRPGLVLFHA